MKKDNRISKHESVTNETATADRTLSRRRVLRTVGGTAAVGVGVSGLSGSAMADSCGEDVDDPEVVFCGCSQVCWCIPYCNVAVVHTEEEWFAFTDTPADSGVEPKAGPWETEFCYEVGDDIDVDLEGEKIIAVEVFNTDGQSDTGSGGWEGVTIFENPNNCAQRSLDNIEIGDRIDKEETPVEGEVGITEGTRPRDVPGGCGEPPCEHPARDSGNGRGGNGQGPPDDTPSKGKR